MNISAIATVYGDLIIKKLRTFDSVPGGLKDQVKEYLTEKGYPELAE